MISLICRIKKAKLIKIMSDMVAEDWERLVKGTNLHL